MCDITDEEFERIYLPVCINYDNYLKEFVIPDVVAFYIADNFLRRFWKKFRVQVHISAKRNRDPGKSAARRCKKPLAIMHGNFCKHRWLS